MNLIYSCYGEATRIPLYSGVIHMLYFLYMVKVSSFGYSQSANPRNLLNVKLFIHGVLVRL
ncbi:hypothetical protein M758_8G173700 [Ceratodon purpureus]|nr:hypothetical protein M758_8G173700 [Ceratodon purpureus]